MTTVAHEALEGIEAVAKARSVVDAASRWTPDVAEALAQGFVEDMDPTWRMSDSPAAKPRLGLSEEGWLLAREHGWTFTCGCAGCDQEHLVKDRHEVREGWVLGPCCSGAARQYGAVDGACKAHARREVG